MRIIILFLLLLPYSALAGQAEAKDAARAYNCKVTAIAPVAMETGTGDQTIYKVGCDTAGISDAEAKKANGTILVRCNGALCTLYKKGE